MGLIHSSTSSTFNKRHVNLTVSDVVLPATVHETQPVKENYYVALVTHGLGIPNPRQRNHENDVWVQQVLVPGLKRAQPIINPIIAYTARGHGLSQGWQHSAAQNVNQFTWKKLGSDMKFLVNKCLQDYPGNNLILCGNSMGSALSLFAAVESSYLVRGVIMLRPPAAWEARQARHNSVISGILRFRHQHAHNPQALAYSYALEGASMSDFPATSSLFYKMVPCPVLLLAVKHDPAHPVATAQKLHKHLPESRLEIAENQHDAETRFPKIIAEFIQSIVPKYKQINK